MDAPFTLTSPAFELGEPIPARYTCDGENHSPALMWTEPPAGTRSLAIAMEDPDAPSGEFVHWLGWGLEPHLRELPEGVEPPYEGRNGFGEVALARAWAAQFEAYHGLAARVPAHDLVLPDDASRLEETLDRVAATVLPALLSAPAPHA